MSLSLFSALPPLLLPAVPGETFFSWLVRYHRICGAVSYRETSRRLFAHPTAMMRHDLPVGLDRFVERSLGTLGAVDRIVGEMTIFPLFAPFLEGPLLEKVMSALRGTSASSIDAILGLPGSQVFPPIPLKACRECIAEDLGVRRFSSWYVHHQFPGTFLCLKHRLPLYIATERFHLRRHLQFSFPHELRPDQWELAPLIDDRQFGVLQRAALWAQCLAATPASILSSESLRHTYALGAERFGCLTTGGKVRLSELAETFLNEHAGLRELPGLGFISSAEQRGGGFIGSLLRHYPGTRHPIKHLFLMAFLFPRWEDFRATHDRVAGALTEGGTAAAVALRKPAVQQVIELVLSGKSVNASAATSGVQTATAIRNLVRLGIRYRRRARIVGTEAEAQVISMLKGGYARAWISNQIGVRPGFVRDYLRTHPELKVAWQRANFQREREIHRRQLLTTLEAHPDLPIKRIRRLPSNGFQWLYNNDRDWLLEQLPALWRR